MADCSAVAGDLLHDGDGLGLVPDALLELHADGTVVAGNDLAERMFLRNPAGLRLEQLFGDARPLLERLARTGEPLHRRVKLQGRRANGVPFPAEASLRHVRGRALCALRELDFAELVSEASRYFDIAFDKAPIGMAVFNADGEYVRVNAALCRLLGRPAEQLLGHRDQEFTHPDDRQLDVEVAWEVLNGRRDAFQREKRFVRPDGTVAWAIANLAFLRDERGRPLNWVGQFQDVTSLHR
jgi:PAS domain S-box-containing protein